MKETVITWTAVNWGTIFLMAVLPSVVIGLGLRMLAQANGSNSDA